VVIAELIIRSAMQRKESRGLHYMRDFPATNEETGNTILTPGTF
jgi:L-aspartate oxidase